MIRPFTCICMVLACGSGLYLYSEKHQAQMLDREITATMHEAEETRARAGVLRAEWTLQNDPERLAQLSGHFLSLKTVTPGQFTTLAELDKRLPPVRTPESKPSDTTDDNTPEASVPDPDTAKIASIPDPKTETKPEPKAEAKAEAKPEPKPEPVKREASRPAQVKVATAAPRAQERRVPAAPIAVAETRSIITPVALSVPRPVATQYAPSPYVSATRVAAPTPVMTSVLGIARTSIAPPVPFAPQATGSNGG